ncbi:phage conserved hypothetical protein TIGR01671 [Paraprevotella xylaniphila YIT 11841]|uniref:YopX protein domain-containing protein n=2 Tax=root TaxID=1 RepID=F3QQU9_9BACT|nr:YopX family protein [Paraprevotella xylaniphila]EGG56540.1 phage conserved hypothetical protein TIGR01671 [Paraprevotella xylaniphila YIT 11841]DAE17941.1 MAG TPA: YopX protein [Siphoviridae sp. ctr8v12]
MRTIKFRGKSINSGKWVYAILYGFGMDWFDESVDEDTIGQFTGLHDANGKEIYEGDIFQVKAYEPKFEVFFKNGVFEYRQIGIPNRPYPLRRIYFDSYVLGNIHDNPELLKRDTK